MGKVVHHDQKGDSCMAAYSTRTFGPEIEYWMMEYFRPARLAAHVFPPSIVPITTTLGGKEYLEPARHDRRKGLARCVFQNQPCIILV
ncbi:MAG: hypothetical protein A2664_03415 [Candidatus Taylorbacteria bacterium RIFCSPHIGHO2_01_FULL_46_22b]|uniref:Uncharacterized protein n=1 Tax=Candidatus Taylorbacteria bacterium RIFCSPHIGHO2_01_FULL_46_22b TaxID=1802301 RepID=A0A1G2M1F4_9BACT|nr:MAG: hypothetical protein A2664_03415 [Candidatus Taylorbacteria bacterium RIFCSPHIGHO2_01_FULL_46_22b]